MVQYGVQWGTGCNGAGGENWAWRGLNLVAAVPIES